ncbi:MAG: hypothetical protein V1722_04880 [Candidatus Micrarchaeota archaeon]
MNVKYAFLTLFVFTVCASAITTTCGLVNIDYNNDLTLNAGEQGSFTLTAFNRGTATQRISASAQCDPLQLQCSFTGISDSTILAPSEQRTFSLKVKPLQSGAYPITGEFHAGPSASTCIAPLTFNLNALDAQTQTIDPLTVSINPVDSQNARPGDEVTFTITLKNNLNKKIYAGLSSQDTNPFESSTTLSASNVALQSGETKDVVIKVRLPPGTPGGTYTWIYKVDAGNCCGFTSNLQAQITVEAPRLSMQLLNAPVQDECKVANAGSTAAVPLIIKNNEETTGPFDLTIQGTNTVQNIVTLTEPRFTLLTGEEKPFQVNIAPLMRTPIDNYTYKLVGTYQGFKFLDRSFCFKVQGVDSINVTSSRNLVIERMRISNVQINVTNTGSTSDTYALSINPEAQLTAQLQPNSFTLAPGQMQTVAIAFTTNLQTPLGQRIVKLRVDGQKYSKNIDLNATVYATGRTGESLLKITSERQLNVVKGIAKTFNVTVENLGTEALRDVELTLNGIDLSWYVSENNTILAGDNEVFQITITIPTTSEETQFETQLKAQSGREFVTTPLTISTSNVAFDFTITQVIENKNAAGETTSIDLVLNVTNNGATTATQITPLINDLNYIYRQTPATLTLQPGQTAQVQINLKAGNENTQNATLSLQLSAQEGVSGAQTVQVPALTIIKDSNLALKIALILILLIGIFAVLAKTQKKF